MVLRSAYLLMAIMLLALCSSASLAQKVESRPSPAAIQAQEQSTSLPGNRNSLEAVANEIDLVRKSLQTLNARLREISEKLPSVGSIGSSASEDKQRQLASNLDLLSRAEDRAGVLRKQLLELIEKETSYRSRLAQLEEDSRPESVERVLSGVGTTRTPELRDSRRRSLEIEKRGLESLVLVTGQTRPRLEEDLRQALSIVARLRQHLLPLVEKEIEKINPN